MGVSEPVGVGLRCVGFTLGRGGVAVRGEALVAVGLAGDVWGEATGEALVGGAGEVEEERRL